MPGVLIGSLVVSGDEASVFKRGRLLARGLMHFGPRRTYEAQKSLSQTLDAFEERYERLPNQEEQVQIVRKLS